MKTFLIAALIGGALSLGTQEPPPGNLYCPSLTYVGKQPQMNQWCQSTCSQYLGFGPRYLTYCPDGFCKCGDPGEMANKAHCDSPRHCPSGAYEAVPGSTSSDGHCQAICTHNPKECWCTMCRCKESCRDHEDLIDIHFDQVNDPRGTGTRISNIKGITFGGRSYVLNTDKYAKTYGHSGYSVAKKSSPNVFYNGFARTAEISVPNGTLRLLSVHGAGAWHDNLHFVVEAFDSANNLVGAPVEKILSSTVVKYLYVDSPTGHKLVLSSSGGIRNRDYRFGGEHFALDNMKLCVPKNLELGKRVEEVEVVEKRDAQDELPSFGFQD